MTANRGAAERRGAVEVMRRLEQVRGLLAARSLRRAVRQWRHGEPAWPPLPGAYVVGDPRAPVAVCTLTDDTLLRALSAVPGVAITGRAATANLGIEKIIINVTANPAIRFLLVCGQDSPLFHPGQTLIALASDGADRDSRVLGARGYLPVLRGVPLPRIERFRQQVELADHIGETDPAVLAQRVGELAARSPGPLPPSPQDGGPGSESLPGTVGRFMTIKPGGRRREPVGYDPVGYFVISVDHGARQILLQHYRTDNTPAHQMRGHAAEPMLAGLLREDLVSQLSHAGYLGAELAKAETALRLGLAYHQDRPVRDPAARRNTN